MEFIKPTKAEAKLLPITTLTIEFEEGKTKDYQCVLDFNAIIKCEEQIGRDMTQRESWKALNHKEISIIAWASLDRFHPDVTLRELRQLVDPRDWSQLFVMYFEQMFPGVLETVQKALEEKAQGKDQPNATEKA